MTNLVMDFHGEIFARIAQGLTEQSEDGKFNLREYITDWFGAALTIIDEVRAKGDEEQATKLEIITLAEFLSVSERSRELLFLSRHVERLLELKSKLEYQKTFTDWYRTNKI